MTNKSKKKGNQIVGPKAKNIKFGVSRPLRNAKTVYSPHQLKSDLNDVEALTNPWSAAAVGSKVPDADSTRTVAVTIKDFASVATDANGSGYLKVIPNLNGWAAQQTTITDSTITTIASANAIADISSYTGGFASYRIVSWGVRITTNQAPTAQAGLIRLFATDQGVSNGTDLNGTLFDEVHQYALAESLDGIYWMSRPLDNTSREFVGLTTETAWSQLSIFAYGATASATVLNVELVLHAEMVVKLGQVVAAAATPAAEHKPHVMSAAANVIAKRTSHHVGSSIGGFLRRMAVTALGAAVNRFLPGVGNVTVPMIVD